MRWLAGLLLVAAAPALAQPCEGRYPAATPLPADLREAGVRNAWGRDNIAPLAGEPGGLRIRYPAGSINPGNAAAPVGGAGFHWTPGAAAEARCLSYRVRFSEGFDFALGGKLPGLAGGDAPRGCSAAELSRGFSARLMWRARGEGELYLYAPDRAARCGDSIGRGSFRVVPMRWVEIQQEVILNRPGAADGVIRLWVNGQRVLERRDLALRESATVRVNGLLFATFFGGSDARWASPRDQWADFAAVTLWDAVPAR
ncbi:hypothetical protein KTR66_17395 [Roseococcus sp. SDR]|uniref:polysaccharide lyase n=1 Tax=Roseococcus sp. SDR TaxID=2835532 RepID=UPI001BCFB69E|nr:hypothetical protein [Roseococcus sp. SDR]MBS7791779.1 hypothetical protein [Roseococcus sp. SDR]MBV1847093.1 hypothetical protein [Roseococcus sp. SDR]